MARLSIVTREGLRVSIRASLVTRHTFIHESYDFRTPSFLDIGGPTFGLIAFQIDWESDIRTPSFVDSESDFRTPSFSDIGSSIFGLLAFQIDWESGIRTPSFADSEFDFRTTSCFGMIGSPT